MFATLAMLVCLGDFPPKGKTAVIIGGGVSQSHYEAFRGVAGSPPSGQHLIIYGMEDPAPGIVFQSQPPGSSLYIAWAVGDDKMADVAAGRHDAEVERLGRAIMDAGHTVYFSVGGEVDGPRERSHGENYKACHRYIRDVFDRLGVKDICYVTHLACDRDPSLAEIERLYPGDRYTDMLCCSLYGKGNVSGAERLASFARRRGKSFGIAECGGNFVVKKAHRDWGVYWRPVFDFVRRNDVRLLVYLNCKDGTPTADNFDMMSPAVLSRWKEEMHKIRYALGGSR